MRKRKWRFDTVEVGQGFFITGSAEVLRARNAANQDRMRYGRQWSITKVPSADDVWACKRIA